MTTPFLPRGALPGSLLLGSVEDFARQIGEADLFNVFPKVPPSIRQTKAFGQTLSCKVWMKVYRKGTVRAGQASRSRRELQINSKIFTIGTSEHVRETFLHETGHLLADFFYKDKCNHDWRWVRMAKVLGDTADRCHSYPYLKPKPRPRNLTYICTRCGYKYPRSRRLNTSRFVCSMCRGKLQLEVKVPEDLKKALGL